MPTAVARRRRNLWRRDPHCFWCGVLTVLVWECPKVPRGDPRRRPPDNLATVDHLRPRTHPLRLEPNPTGAERTVLACNKCNWLRNKQDYETLPVEVIRMKCHKNWRERWPKSVGGHSGRTFPAFV